MLEEDCCRSDLGQSDAAGCYQAKALRPMRRRELVDWAKADWKVSIRRACSVFLLEARIYRYKSKRGTQAELKQRIKEIAETRVRYGYRRIHVLLRREAHEVNAKRVYRLYKEQGLQLRNKAPKRRVKAKLRVNRMDAVGNNQVWAMDFVHDQLATGRKLRILTVLDIWSRFTPVIDPRFNYKGEDVVRTLDRTCKQYGYPKVIRVDNGSQFISRDIDLWAYQNHVTLDFSLPGKPTDNAFIESFNGKFRQECLNTHWLMSRDDTAEKIDNWRRDYNEYRPHSAIGNKPPISLPNLPDQPSGQRDLKTGNSSSA